MEGVVINHAMPNEPPYLGFVMIRRLGVGKIYCRGKMLGGQLRGDAMRICAGAMLK